VHPRVPGAGLGSDEWEQTFGPVKQAEWVHQASHDGDDDEASRSDGSWGSGYGIHIRRGVRVQEAPRDVHHRYLERQSAARHKLVALRHEYPGERLSSPPYSTSGHALGLARGSVGAGESWEIPELTRVIEADGGLPVAISPNAVGGGYSPIPFSATKTRNMIRDLMPNARAPRHNLAGNDEGREESWDEEGPAEEFEEDIKNAFDLNNITLAEIPIHMWAWWFAVAFVVLTVAISSNLILQHLNHYDRPEVQKYIVRILFMAPLYGIDALLSLTFDNAAPILNVFRDCYEAFTLYNFVKMLYVWLGGERAVIQRMSDKKQMPLLFPLNWMEPWEMGDEMFYNCKFGVLQYVIVIPICAIVTFVTVAAGAYEGREWYTMDLWINMVSLLSSTWAIYCLITFYLAMQEELEASVSNALGKFLCVKLVVFFCFWQMIALQVILMIGYVPETAQYSQNRFVEAIELWLICFEMFVISIFFYYAFPVEEIKEMRQFKETSSDGKGYGATTDSKVALGVRGGENPGVTQV